MRWKGTAAKLTYIGESIKIKCATYRQQSTQLPVLIASGKGPGFLGHDRFKVIRLNWTEIFQVWEGGLSEFKWYENVFCNELGKNKELSGEDLYSSRGNPLYF